MNKQDVIGELLYIGFVAEKGRCYGTRWSYVYRQRLKKHAMALGRLNDLLLNDGDINSTLESFIMLCKSDNEIGKFYRFSQDIKSIKWENNASNFDKVNRLIKKLLDDLYEELNKLFINKRNIYSLLCALHNLPRVYLGKDKSTLCELQQPGISEEDALLFTFQNMNEYEKKRCKVYFESISNIKIQDTN